ncbi:hypothetical protein HO702_05640 [Streptococcus suis]|uniref:Uncharacterized protein n=1 Tax=Streptococcus suis TaxID=1307 RepID=A0A0Z8LBD7_STRSU|nr:hypothetical protein [Streptococcus suis]NQG75696.1 hypothetical protein [Streptococcus suis]NQG79540.1 hypothetical protein [Streptococcus suis]CYV80653.1 Uncharacterised protein [Streptococcus suis]CYV87588.1 Uncharacterised protein [Streptococcus suis]HEM6045020.1 hypothetical protein [Streptococcus suis]
MSNHVENKKDVNLIVAYKLGDRYNGEILARSVLYAHYFHAINNGDKVLFTVKTENVTKVGNKETTRATHHDTRRFFRLLHCGY